MKQLIEKLREDSDKNRFYKKEAKSEMFFCILLKMLSILVIDVDSTKRKVFHFFHFKAKKMAI